MGICVTCVSVNNPRWNVEVSMGMAQIVWPHSIACVCIGLLRGISSSLGIYLTSKP